MEWWSTGEIEMLLFAPFAAMEIHDGMYRFNIPGPIKG